MKRQGRIVNTASSMFICIGLLFPSLLFSNQPPEVEVWLDRGDGGVYYNGDAMTVYFKTDRPAYVTVYNIDTDGFVSVLYPYYPGMDNYVAGGKAYTIPGGGYDLSLFIEEPVGIGYIEAVASDEPFALEDWPFLSGSDEPTEAVGVTHRITGDPFLAIEEINKEILPYGEVPTYRDDFAIYYVEEIVHYPRYLCSDCHLPSYYHYDPYDYYCPSYYVVVYDYWYYNDFCFWDFYYPYGYYDYYYYYPRSSSVGHRYSRKYDYRPRDGGIYRTKGEVPLSGGAIRVRDRQVEVRVVEPSVNSEDGNGALPIAYQGREIIVEGGSPSSTPLPSHHEAVGEGRTSRADGRSAIHQQGTVEKSAESRPVGRPVRKPIVEENRASGNPARKPVANESPEPSNPTRKPVVEETRQSDSPALAPAVEDGRPSSSPIRKPAIEESRKEGAGSVIRSWPSERSDPARESGTWKGRGEKETPEVGQSNRRSATGHHEGSSPRRTVSREPDVRITGYPGRTPSLRSDDHASRSMSRLGSSTPSPLMGGLSGASRGMGDWSRGLGRTATRR